MHEIAGPALLVAIETSALAQALRDGLWLYPIVEIVHIGAIVVVVGAVAMFDLRLLGRSPSLPIRALAHHLLPWSMTAFAIAAASGGLMFTAHATTLWTNPAFVAKLCLLAAAGLNAFVFHAGSYRTAALWEVARPVPAAARFAAAASLLLWIGVIGCGRLIAYF